MQPPSPFSFPNDYHLAEGDPGFFRYQHQHDDGQRDARDGGKIGGLVTKQSDGSVVQYPSLASHSSPGCAFVNSTSGAIDGTYVSGNVPPGDYRVNATSYYDLTLGTAWLGGGTSCATALGVVHVVAGATATANIALPPKTVGPAGFKVSGVVTNSVTHAGVSSSVQLQNTTDHTFYFGFADGCGAHSATGLTPGSYNATISATGYRTLNVTGAFTITNADVTRNFVIDPLSGEIRGNVMSASLPVMGAQICIYNGGCTLTDQLGNYRIGNLDTGMYKVICFTMDGLEGSFYNHKGTLATADKRPSRTARRRRESTSISRRSRPTAEKSTRRGRRSS